jgi:pseudouridine kinase
LENFDRGLALAPGAGRVLDWGCGAETLSLKLLRERGLAAEGWDPLCPGSVLPDSPEVRQSFDLVFCLEAAGYFADPPEEFSRLASWLKPGGLAVIHTPLAPAGPEELARWRHIRERPCLSFYSKKALAILAASACLRWEGMEETPQGARFFFRRPLPVLAAGGVTLDLEGQSDKPLVPGDSNPGRVRMAAGGVGRNMAENLCRLGLEVEFVSALGRDFFGTFILKSCQKAGLGTAGVRKFKNESSPIYLSLLDDHHDMALALSGMSLFDRFDASQALAGVDRAESAARKRSFCPGGGPPFSALLLDGNLLPPAALAVRRRFPGLTAWMDPVSGSKGRRAAAYREGELLRELDVIKPNGLEVFAMIGAAPGPSPGLSPELLKAGRILLNRGPRRIYISLGEEGVARLESSKTAEAPGAPLVFKSPGAPLGPRIISATGAGDALTAGLLFHSLIREGSFLAAGAGEDLITGSAAAAFALASPQAVSEKLNPGELITLILKWEESAENFRGIF